MIQEEDVELINFQFRLRNDYEVILLGKANLSQWMNYLRVRNEKYPHLSRSFHFRPRNSKSVVVVDKLFPKTISLHIPGYGGPTNWVLPDSRFVTDKDCVITLKNGTYEIYSGGDYFKHGR